MIDVDLFKHVNDTHGHYVGDEVLKQIANTLQSSLRETDTVFRYGGEEFLVLLPDTNFEVAHSVAEKLRIAVSSNPHTTAGEVHISVGVAVASPEQDNEDRAIIDADQHLYNAKNSGRNRVMPDPIVFDI